MIGQIALTAALLIAATLEIRSIRNQLQLDYGYDENAIYSARMALMEGAYHGRWAPRIFQARRSRIARQSAVRIGRAKRSLSNDVCRPAVSMKLTVKII